MRSVCCSPLITSFLLFTMLAIPIRAQEYGYAQQPALHDNRIVFTSEDDLWTATLREDDQPIIAHRLTTGLGLESRPAISPDGRWVAFTGAYDGNADVYIMPIDGGVPRRLTFHPERDLCVTWTPDSSSVVFHSPRAHHFGWPELWKISISGGMPEKYDFGPATLASLNDSGKVIAFTQWSNEHWSWKRYRGGTAPEIWLGDLTAKTFRQLTNDPANDLFPMWSRGRLYFLSDRAGSPNIFSARIDGGDVKQHTTFAPRDDQPTAIEGYDIRWPSMDAKVGGQRIIFAQGGRLAILNTADDSIRRLDVRLMSDRAALRGRFAEVMASLTDFSLAPDGSRLLVAARGELLSFPVEDGRPYQLTRESGSREWGARYAADDRVVFVSDSGGEQQLAAVPADGSGGPGALTDDLALWLFPPVASPDGRMLIFGDKTQRLHLYDLVTGQRRTIDRSEAWEITDYRFSPDGQWVAYTKPLPNGYSQIHLYSVRTERTFPVSDELTHAVAPRFGPKGRYLFFLGRAEFNPLMSEVDFEHIFTRMMRIFVVPLAANEPPPIPAIARAAGVDLSRWADPAHFEPPMPLEEGQDAERDWRMRVDTDGIMSRAVPLAIEADNYRDLEVAYGRVLVVRDPQKGLLEDVWPPPPPGVGDATLIAFDLLQEEASEIAKQISSYTISNDRSTIAWPVRQGFLVRSVGGGDPVHINVAELPVPIDVRAEWFQIFQEAWRLQRDFYWAPNFVGVNWDAMRTKYAALLPRIGTRLELNDLIGEMIGELRTSHTYVWGGEEYAPARQVPVGLLGADIEFRDGGFRFARILPSVPWNQNLISPLAASHLNLGNDPVLLAINGQPLTPGSNVYELLQGLAGKSIILTVADDPGGVNRRTIEVHALGSERELRYLAWVEANRQRVSEASDGRLGYLHIPDMDGVGLQMFSRYFYPQINKRGLVIDIRDNGGGFVSQMIVQRLARTPWAYSKPRHGAVERYPARSLDGHLAVIIDEHAGSDGDIFPESFRILELGPLIGTRTWGGVVGIRMDKPFVDAGVSSQPEFAWWEPKRGWSLENEGVTPDIVLPITPTDYVQGRDPQLARTIELLLQKLENDPKNPPEAPPYPDRVDGN